MDNWQGKRIVILGAARQGLALARFLARSGAQVTLNDQRPAEQLQAAIQSMQGLEVTWVLGEHPLALLDGCDLLAVSGGVPLTMPLVVEAIRRGIPVSNDSQVFMQSVPCRVVGITGSAGKTTTTTLLGRMAQAAIEAPRQSWVGGNIGIPLIDHLHEIQADDLVILELSSFQLELMTSVPQISAILNITPNHLDRHGTMEAYSAAKARILDYQKPGDVAVLNREDAGAWKLAGSVRGRLVSFGLRRPEPGQEGTFLDGENICLQSGATVRVLFPRSMVLLRGEHNLVNVLAACAIAHAAGMSAGDMLAGVNGFTGVAHRLEFVREWRGARWYNDSIATAPERTLAAIQSFDAPLVLLLGGRDKNLPWADLAATVHQRVDHVVVFGEAGEKIIQAMGSLKYGQRPFSLVQCAGLRDAVQAAANLVEPGDVVLLSPGGTSYDEFRDFEERGERFREWVHQLQ
ncbi:MAG TPA: UDP-N-acetylmuramoyl-L-alanine--D-glutamate ligase [Anaerolineaceae bacterium]|nr:UDP-N-acetylmuramoyl-L-alanine--D-glutamate ligase [Anaerolineaceae bacterium]